MSDRPVRLKYLTKMKIILCIFLPCITAVSVFSKSQELHGIVGKSIEFTYAVKTAGSLFYDSKAYGASAIGAVKNGNFAPQNENFRDRLQWDSSTGHFSLSELRLSDSGIYKVQNDGQKSVSFSLTVWKEDVPVLKPRLSVTRNEYRCTLLCAAVRGTGATLTLYREGETNPYVTSPGHSHPDLNMTVPVESGTYTCEAKNSVSRETSDPLTVGAHCTAERELNSILGESVKFPAPVKIEGSLRYSTLPIGTVISGRFWRGRNVEYSSRLQWDNSTGLFSLSELRMEDSGVYTVQNTDQNINTVFQLNVYIPVSKPHVSITHNEYPCTIECTAESGTEVTLSWYRQGEKKPYVSSRVASAEHLNLTVERSGTYTCEAKNSVSNEKASITVGDHCTAPSSPNALAIVLGIAGVAVLIACFFAVKYCCIKRKILEIRSKHRAVRRLILVEKLLDIIVAAAPESQTFIDDALKRATQVKEISEVVAPAHDEDRQAFIHGDEDRQAFIHCAFTRLIQVHEISKDIVAPAHVEDMQVLHSNVKKFLDIVVAPASDTGSKSQAVRTTILDEDEQAIFLSGIRSLILDIRSLILELRGQAKGSDEPKNGTP